MATIIAVATRSLRSVFEWQNWSVGVEYSKQVEAV